MNTLTLIIGVLVGAALTGAVVFILKRKESAGFQSLIDSERLSAATEAKQMMMQEQATQQAELASTKSDLSNAKSRIEELKNEKEELNSSNSTLQTTITQLNAELTAAKEKLELQKQHADEEKAARTEREQQEKKEREEKEAKAKAEREEQAQKQLELLKTEFENSSAKLLKERQKEFRESSSESIDQILTPLKEKISEMSQSMTDNKASQDELKGQLESQIKSIMEQTKLTSDSANNLAMALKGQNKTQGDYGERQLVEMLESFGFQQGQQILPQAYITDEYGRKLRDDCDSKMRPDVILKTDNTHVIIIDSKMVLKDYMDYIEAYNNGDEKGMSDAIERNTTAILNQVDLLAKQNYAAYIQKPLETVEYTLMYVPMAGALRLAQANRPSLWHDALAKKIIIVDEYSLYAMLRVIELTWSKIEQVNNSQKIVDTATMVLERVEALLEKVVDAESAIKTAADSLQEGHNLLTDGGKSIVTAAKQLQNLGIHSSSKEYRKRLKKTAVIHEQLGEDLEAAQAVTEGATEEAILLEE